MDSVTKDLLGLISDMKEGSEGAFNIRENGSCAGVKSTKHIRIEPKPNASGIVIRISGDTKHETVFIPACVTRSGINDLAYNDFIVEDGADVIIVAGCGVHSNGKEETRHSGLHHFQIGKGAKVLYKEKHIGTGDGTGAKKIDPVTDIVMEEDSYMEMDTMQIRGVTETTRSTTAVLKAGAKLIIRERLLTDDEEKAYSDFSVTLDGEDSGVDLISRSVAKGNSYQEYKSVIKGNCRCTGHSECDAILSGNGIVNAAPALYAGHIDASLIHEAAIGKIAGEQIIKLCTLGLTEEEAEQKIIEGFLK
ncbi:MAG: SufD family Fe-S cluster assembly protein [Lachnospiraceae bacterium]|nr:SufD family Fe-S cluster assembly protein [Lachnospiraceae bacterium]